MIYSAATLSPYHLTTLSLFYSFLFRYELNDASSYISSVSNYTYKKLVIFFLFRSYSSDSLSELDSVRDWMPFTHWLNAFQSLTHCTPIQKVPERGWKKWQDKKDKKWKLRTKNMNWFIWGGLWAKLSYKLRVTGYYALCRRRIAHQLIIAIAHPLKSALFRVVRIRKITCTFAWLLNL